MLKDNYDSQDQMEWVSIEQLVPRDHRLRKIEKTIDLSFIRDRVRHLYCADNGRPAIDPVVLFKMILIGYLFGIRSERELCRQIQVNVAYRWFLRLGLNDKVPDASTLSQNRRRRFDGSDIYQQIFDEVVEMTIRTRLVDGSILYTDSTHLKASANKHYFKKKWIKASTTDPDAGYMVRDGKPKGFFYLDHRTVDGKFNIITDTHATSAALHDPVVYLDRLDRVRKRFGFDVQAVGLDAGYQTAAICKGLNDRNIYGVIAYRRLPHRKGFLYKRDYVYDEYYDCYLCPQNKVLSYRTTDRNGYRHYASDASDCSSCPLKPRCTSSANGIKVVTRHVW